MTLALEIMKMTSDILREYPDANLKDAWCNTQIQSKKWLINTLEAYYGTKLGLTYICACWYGLLPFLMEDRFDCRIIGWDFDIVAVEIARIMNPKDTVHFFEKNIHDVNYDAVETVINTSCEHIVDFSDWYDKIPKGKVMALQSNNFFDCEGHINCHIDLDHFKTSVPMDTYLFGGTLSFDEYDRFMIIGIK